MHRISVGNIRLFVFHEFMAKELVGLYITQTVGSLQGVLSIGTGVKGIDTMDNLLKCLKELLLLLSDVFHLSTLGNVSFLQLLSWRTIHSCAVLWENVS